MLDLEKISVLLNLLVMGLAFWLGLYIITRSPHSLTSWLAALTLFALTGHFLRNALAFEYHGSGILISLNKLVIIVLPLWFHLTVLLLPPGAASPRLARWNRIAVPLAYAYAIILIAVGLFTPDLFSPVETGSPFLTNSRAPGSAYPFFVLLLLLGVPLTLYNLWVGRKHAPSPSLARSFDALFIATILAGLSGLYIGISTLLGIIVPTFPNDLSFGVGVVLLGYAVARYDALLEGRPIERDFLYTLLVVGALTAFYVGVTYILYLNGFVSFLTLALTILGIIAANSLYDAARSTLDRVFYHGRFLQLRANLRGLAVEAGSGKTLEKQLQQILDALCRTVDIQKGFIALRNGEEDTVVATHEANPAGEVFPAPALTTAESIGLVRPKTKTLSEMKLLVPLYADGSQIGSLVLGARAGDEPYRDQDLDLLEDVGDQIARVIHSLGVQSENARQLNALVTDFRGRERELQLQIQQLMDRRPSAPVPAADELNEETLQPLVEDALRQLHDFAYLGEMPLAKLRVVDARVSAKTENSLPTFIDRGKALSDLFTALIGELRPDGPEPKATQVASREWHQYYILHDSYVLDEPNRNIMSKLYISEGTFNRTRRRALRNLTKSLQEMEVAARPNS